VEENNQFLHCGRDFWILLYWTEEEVQKMLLERHLSLAKIRSKIPECTTFFI
jgi:hypothetical protein